MLLVERRAAPRLIFLWSNQLVLFVLVDQIRETRAMNQRLGIKLSLLSHPIQKLEPHPEVFSLPVLRGLLPLYMFACLDAVVVNVLLVGVLLVEAI